MQYEFVEYAIVCEWFFQGEAERDRLVHELDEKKADLRAVHESLAAAEKSSREAQAQTELLGEEKKNLQTQLTGLKHRINQFEVDCQLILHYLYMS